MAETITVPAKYSYQQPTTWPVSKRMGVWVLVKLGPRHGYRVYHAPEGEDPQSIPDVYFQGRSSIPSFAESKARFQKIVDTFPAETFERGNQDHLRALLATLEAF